MRELALSSRRERRDVAAMRALILIAPLLCASVGASSLASAQTFAGYDGKPVIRTGDGGTRKVVDGIDFWQSGEPPHRYQVFGTIDDSRHETGIYGMIRMKQLDHDVARSVHAAGGDAVIITNEGEKFLGVASFANMNASGNYGGGYWSANGNASGFARPMKSHQISYVVVKYLSDAPPKDISASSTPAHNP